MSRRAVTLIKATSSSKHTFLETAPRHNGVGSLARREGGDDGCLSSIMIRQRRRGRWIGEVTCSLQPIGEVAVYYRWAQIMTKTMDDSMNDGILQFVGHSRNHLVRCKFRSSSKLVFHVVVSDANFKACRKLYVNSDMIIVDDKFILLEMMLRGHDLE